MDIVSEIKDIIGYSGNDYDIIFSILAVFIVLYFISTLFSILTSVFKRSY